MLQQVKDNVEVIKSLRINDHRLRDLARQALRLQGSRSVMQVQRQLHHTLTHLSEIYQGLNVNTTDGLLPILNHHPIVQFLVILLKNIAIPDGSSLYQMQASLSALADLEVK